jgi:hypothetical protein
MFHENTFGMIKFNGKSYSHDIVIHTDDRVEKRDKNLSREKYGTSHVLSTAEIENLLDENPEVFVVGRGQSGMLKVGEDVVELLSAKNVNLLDFPTPDAIKEFNKLKDKGKKVAAIIHITC